MRTSRKNHFLAKCIPTSKKKKNALSVLIVKIRLERLRLRLSSKRLTSLIMRGAFGVGSFHKSEIAGRLRGRGNRYRKQQVSRAERRRRATILGRIYEKSRNPPASDVASWKESSTFLSLPLSPSSENAKNRVRRVNLSGAPGGSLLLLLAHEIVAVAL
jgi:hypothetical protein